MKNKQNWNSWCDLIIFFCKGKLKKIYKRIAPTLGDSCSSYKAVGLWVNKFKPGRTSIENALRSETPEAAVTPENINKVHDIVLADRRVQMGELAEAAAISIDRVHFILCNGRTLFTSLRNCLVTLANRGIFGVGIFTELGR